jgi:nucleoid DNA-binding protein
MRKLHRGAAVGVLAAVLAFTAPGLSEKSAAGEKDKPASFTGRIAADAKVPEEEVARVLTALGPAVRDQLAQGERVDLPGLGVFRVVRIPEHRDLVGGRPAVIAANNYVDFTATGVLVDAANAAGAVPQDTVQPFEFNPLPGQTKGLHVPNERMPNVRTR